MDIWRPFRLATAAHAPNAAILFDKFHVVRHLGEALDAVRKSEYGRLAGRDRRYIKGQKYHFAAQLDGTARLPVPYPTKQSVVANLVATVGMREGWGADFVRAAYRRWFQRGEETGSEPNLSESLHDIGQEPKRVLALANSENTKATLVAETDAARELGIFGSPTFTVGRELFWGDDRLADAISWCRFGRVQHDEK